jgi:hypothetical protein
MLKWEFKPKFIRKESEVKSLLKKKSYIKYVDAYSRQIREMFFIDNNRFIVNPKDEFIKLEFKIIRKRQKTFFIFYPGITAYQVVKGDDYFRLKTNRNQDLITA